MLRCPFFAVPFFVEQEASKKPPNVSLYVLGEYNILIDDLSKSARTPSARPPIATRAVTDDLSKSARTPRARPATADHAVSDSLSQSARTPRAGGRGCFAMKSVGKEEAKEGKERLICLR